MPKDLDNVEKLSDAFKSMRQGRGIAEDETAMRAIPREVWALLGAPVEEAMALDYLFRSLKLAVEASPPDDRKLLRPTLNLDGRSKLDWGDRLDGLSESSPDKESVSTTRRRVDKALNRLAVRMLANRRSQRTQPVGPFNLDLADFFPRITEDGLAHLHVVVGSTERERLGDAAQFAASELKLKLDEFSEDSSFQRQVTSGTVWDLVRVVDLAAVIAREASPRVTNDFEMELCVSEVAVGREMLTDHLILVGGPDTNLFIALASIACLEIFGEMPPIRYSGEEARYFTCDQFESLPSGQRYRRLEESGDMHCGYIVHARNPWNSDRTLTIVSGIRGTGTQAALLALIIKEDELSRSGRAKDPWRRLGTNNRYRPDLSAKVVRASRARIAEGNEVVTNSRTIEVPPTHRISQRHVVTDFVFEE